MIDEKVLRSALDASSEGVMIFATGSHGWECVYANPSSAMLFGFNNADILGPVDGSSNLFSVLLDKSLRPNIRQTLSMGQSFRYTFEVGRLTGGTFWCELNMSPLNDDDGNWTHTIMVAHDVSSTVRYAREIESKNRLLREQNSALENIASRDDLTGLYNRRHFDAELARMVGLHERLGFPLSIAFFDVDFFKKFNDSYGHQAGDDVLREIAMVLQDGFSRETDVVARYGGEEFVVLSIGESLVTTFYQHVDTVRDGIAALAIPHKSSSCASVVTISAGIYFGDLVTPGQPQSVIEAADRALYQAKHAGRNRVEISDLVEVHLPVGPGYAIGG